MCIRDSLRGVPRIRKIVDDILCWGETKEELIETFGEIIKRCSEANITLSKEKIQVGTQVKFAGFLIGKDGIKPDPEKVEAIRNLKVPENLTDIRGIFGLVNQFDPFHPDLKHALDPLRELQSIKRSFVWLPEHQVAFEKLKEIICKEDGPVLALYNAELPVELHTDASRTGLGYALLQTDRTGKTRLICCGSRFLSKAEDNYAVCELEALAIQYAIQKCDLYLSGRHFDVSTDHKPLAVSYTHLTLPTIYSV